MNNCFCRYHNWHARNQPPSNLHSQTPLHRYNVHTSHHMYHSLSHPPHKYILICTHPSPLPETSFHIYIHLTWPCIPPCPPPPHNMIWWFDHLSSPFPLPHTLTSLYTYQLTRPSHICPHPIPYTQPHTYTYPSHTHKQLHSVLSTQPVQKNKARPDKVPRPLVLCYCVQHFTVPIQSVSFTLQTENTKKPYSFCL